MQAVICLQHTLQMAGMTAEHLWDQVINHFLSLYAMAFGLSALCARIQFHP